MKYSVRRIQARGYLFILPAIAFFFVFLVYPMVSSFVLSVYEWDLLTPRVFVGLKNFSRMILDQRVLHSLYTTLHFTAFSLVFLILLAFIYASIFSSKLLRSKNVFQSFIFLPVVLSTVAIGVVWKYMFQSSGILSVVAARLLRTQIPWLTSTVIAPYAMIIVNVWKYTGYYMVIFIAGFLNIPQTLFEAAVIDGANYWSQLFYITIPSLKNTFTLAIVSCFIFSFGSFPIQYIITEGGPSRSTEVLTILIYRTAFNFTKVGYGASISVLYFVILLLVAIVQLRVLKPNV